MVRQSRAFPGYDSGSLMRSLRLAWRRMACAFALIFASLVLIPQTGLAGWSNVARRATATVRPTAPLSSPTASASRPRHLPASKRSVSPLVVPPGSWPTYHHDLARSGFDGQQPVFNGVKAGWTSANLDGDVYAEPLVDGNTIVVATENNSVYGLNATTGAVLWQTNLGAPVAAASMPCGDVDPVGITSTPVIDPVAGLVYVVGLLNSPSIHYVLAAIQIGGATPGHISWQRTIPPTTTNPPSWDPTIENQRGALSLDSGTLYIPFGGRAGDCGSYHGYLFATPAMNTSSFSWFASSTDTAGGFWQPAGPTIDASGNVYITSGNSNDNGTYDGGETVFKLSSTLTQLDYFAPSEWQSLNASDTDLGSSGPLLVGNGLIFQVGKAGVGYLLNQNHLGGIGGQLFSAQVCPQTTDAAFGGAAYVAPYIYVPCSGGLVALTLAQGPCGLNFSQAWQGPATAATPPIVAGGLVWIMDNGSGTFYALNPTTGATVFSDNIGGADHFVTASAGDGSVFIAATNVVYSFVSSGTPGGLPSPYPTPSPFNGPPSWWCQPIVNPPSPSGLRPWWR